MKALLGAVICCLVGMLTIVFSGLIVLSNGPLAGGDAVTATEVAGVEAPRSDVELQVLASGENAGFRTVRHQRVREREAQAGVPERAGTTAQPATVAQQSRNSSGSKWIYVPQF